MKYIVVEVKKGGGSMEFPILFPDALVHADVAQTSEPMFRRMFPDADSIRPISAGNFSSYDVRVDPVGRSDTLNLPSRSEDRQLISMCDYGSVFAKL